MTPPLNSPSFPGVPLNWTTDSPEAYQELCRQKIAVTENLCLAITISLRESGLLNSDTGTAERIGRSLFAYLTFELEQAAKPQPIATHPRVTPEMFDAAQREIEVLQNEMDQFNIKIKDVPQEMKAYLEAASAVMLGNQLRRATEYRDALQKAMEEEQQ